MSTGWVLSEEARTRLLTAYPPRYARTVAHHVTLPSAKDDEPLPAPAHFRIVGRADDGAGVEVMIVSKDGDTARPDGGTWHITWSLEQGREARESNDVIAAQGWPSLEGGAIETAPGRWR